MRNGLSIFTNEAFKTGPPCATDLGQDRQGMKFHSFMSGHHLQWLYNDVLHQNLPTYIRHTLSLWRFNSHVSWSVPRSPTIHQWLLQFFFGSTHVHGRCKTYILAMTNTMWDILWDPCACYISMWVKPFFRLNSYFFFNKETQDTFYFKSNFAFWWTYWLYIWWYSNLITIFRWHPMVSPFWSLKRHATGSFPPTLPRTWNVPGWVALRCSLSVHISSWLMHILKFHQFICQCSW